jgi:hypothetical protein
VESYRLSSDKVRVSKKYWDYLVACKRVSGDSFLSPVRDTTGESYLLPSPEKISTEVTKIDPEIGDEVLEDAPVSLVVKTTFIPRDEPLCVDLDRFQEKLDKSKPADITDFLFDPVFDKGVLGQMTSKNPDVWAAKLFKFGVEQVTPLNRGMSSKEVKELLGKYGEDRATGILLPLSFNINPEEFRSMMPTGGRKRGLIQKVSEFLEWMQ